MFFERQFDAAAQRQRQLQDRSARLRGRLADDLQVLRGPLALADRLRLGWRWLHVHPEALAGAAMLLAVARPRRIWRLASRSWALWQLWRRLRRWHADWLSAPPPR